MAQETLSGSCFLSSSSQLQMSSPGCGKMAKSSSCSDGRAADPAWERSCSWALVTPLTTIKQYHSASENKICVSVTSPSSPALPSRDSRGLCYRHGGTVVAHWLQANICWGATTRRAPGETRGGGGAGPGRDVGSRTHTQPHFEAWLFRKGCSGTPWHSAGCPGLCHKAGHTQTLGRGSLVPTLILSVTSQSHQQMSGSLVVSLEAWVSLSPGSVGDRAKEGEPRWQGAGGRARPS